MHGSETEVYGANKAEPLIGRLIDRHVFLFFLNFIGKPHADQFHIGRGLT
jgi:hypothetical protein